MNLSPDAALYMPMPVQRENPAYLSEQLITYLGNKRKLLNFIGAGVGVVKQKLGKDKLSCLDLFSGSGIVARYLKQHSSLLIVNDLEAYSKVINTCYLSSYSRYLNSSYEDHYQRIQAQIEAQDFQEGFIRKLYSPANDQDIKHGERAFYTNRNALFIDTVRQYIESIPSDLQAYFLAPLLSEASIHSNTAGVFKGFYKDLHSGIGKFGGTNRNALSRITTDMQIRKPVFSSFEVEYNVYQEDANSLVQQLDELDLAYLDPPYNQHPYGSNYFMLNLITNYQEPKQISEISGIPVNWNKSRYNKPQMAYSSFSELIRDLKARFILISFNSEGFIYPKQMSALLKAQGKLSVIQTRYNTFRGCRNLHNRTKHVQEYLYLLQK
ncbi:MAG: DNA adenine methylase [Candidatus Cloacimonetes bacterium]|nr:DNA adenine methylase [Candidatus Cloacimonadota bacterium]